MRLEKIQDAIKALYKVALHLVPRNCQETQRRTGSGDMRGECNAMEDDT